MLENNIDTIEINAEEQRPALGIAKAIGLMVVFFIAHGIATKIASIFGSEAGSGSSILVGVTLSFFLILWLSVVWGGGCIRESGLFKSIPLWLAVALVVSSFGAAVLVTELGLRLPLPARLFSESASSGTLPFIFGSVVVVPFFEEVFFRGQILNNFRARYSTRKAIWASAILFSAFHLSNPLSAAFALPFGAAFAWLAIRTGTIVPGLFSHAVLNLSSIVLIPRIAQTLGYSEEALWAWNQLPFNLVVVGAVGLTVGLSGIIWGFRSNQFVIESRALSGEKTT